MGKIKIESTTAAKIFVDEKEIGKINREVKEFEVENGVHVIYAKASWCGSQKTEINVNDEEPVVFTLSSFQYETLARVIMMAFVGLFMLTKSFIFIILAVLPLLYGLYHVTIAKDKYLVFNIKNEQKKLS